MGLASRLLAAFRRQQLSPGEVFDLARQDRLTGAVTFHFRDGIPRAVSYGQPYQSTLVEEEDSVSHQIPCRAGISP